MHSACSPSSSLAPPAPSLPLPYQASQKCSDTFPPATSSQPAWSPPIPASIFLPHRPTPRLCRSAPIHFLPPVALQSACGPAPHPPHTCNHLPHSPVLPPLRTPLALPFLPPGFAEVLRYAASCRCFTITAPTLRLHSPASLLSRFSLSSLLPRQALQKCCGTSPPAAASPSAWAPTAPAPQPPWSPAQASGSFRYLPPAT